MLFQAQRSTYLSDYCYLLLLLLFIAQMNDTYIGKGRKKEVDFQRMFEYNCRPNRNILLITTFFKRNCFIFIM